MSKRIIAAAIANETGITHRQADAATAAIFDAIVKTLRREGKFQFSGIGTLRVYTLPKRKRMNPRTGEKIIVGKSKTIRLKASARLRRKL